RHMGACRRSVQVLYPTLCLHAFTARPEIDVAICKSYNRWIAKANGKSRGRLRWVAGLPPLNIDKAVEEVRWAKDHGACGVFKKGIECGDRAASDPYFFPVYEEASHLDLPICIHNATGNVESATAEGSGLGGGMVAIAAFSALVEHGVPDLFPKLRVGFIETGASWIPYLYADLVAKKLRRTFLPIDFKEDLFRRYRFYVACQTNDDLPYILKYGTEDSLMIGTDYSHAASPPRCRPWTSSSSAPKKEKSPRRLPARSWTTIRAGSTVYRRSSETSPYSASLRSRYLLNSDGSQIQYWRTCWPSAPSGLREINVERSGRPRLDAC